jgi:transcriptional regulator with XRE-family HTH domain
MFGVERTTRTVRKGWCSMVPISAKRVGRRLREIRTMQGYSQGWVEHRSGVPKARISRYENGHVMPSVPSLDRIAAVLGFTLADFFTGA